MSTTMNTTPSPDQRARFEAQCTLEDCPTGLFIFNGTLCFKSEYGDNNGDIHAYVVFSGEAFWGGTSSIAAKRLLLVTPITNEHADSLLTQPTPPREVAQGLREDLGVLIARFGRACYDYAMARDATKEEVSVAYEKQEKLRDQVDCALATLGQQRDAARGEVEALEATIRTYRPAVNEAHDLRQQLAEIDAVLGKRAHDVVGAAKDAMDDNAELRQQLAEALAALAPYVTAPSSPAPTSGKEGTPLTNEFITKEHVAHDGMWIDFACLLETKFNAAREELAAVQNRKIEACIAWTEAQAQLATLRAERDKFQDMARASESALTAVSWPLVKADRSGDSPDVIAERLVSQLATLRATSEELAGALEEAISKRAGHSEWRTDSPEVTGKPTRWVRDFLCEKWRAALARHRAATPAQPVPADEADGESKVDPAVFHAQEILEVIMGAPVEELSTDVEEVADYIRTKMTLADAPIPPSAPTEEQIEAAAREICHANADLFEASSGTKVIGPQGVLPILRKHLLSRTHGGKGT